MFERDLDNESEDQRERLRFWLTIGLGAILTGVVAALVLLLARANDDYDRSLGWQAHSLEIISQTRSLDAALARAEAALGRFAVGLQKEDGRVYQQQWGLALQYLTLLQRNVRDNPKQAELVAKLTKELASRGQQLGDAALSANYNQTIAPFVVTNRGAITERWALRFVSSTQVDVIGENVGNLGRFPINAEIAPINPTANAPYFSVKAAGWGAGWNAGNTLFIRTIGAIAPFNIVRTVQKGAATVQDDRFCIVARANVDRP